MSARLIGTVVVVALLGLPAAAEARRGVTLGFYDPVLDSPSATDWLRRAADARGEIVRIAVDWSRVAPSSPRLPRNPADPAYDWAAVDAAIDAALAAGLQVLPCIGRAPAWAREGKAPDGVEPTSWRPEPSEVGAFATALARHLAGRVRYIQLWNEPNLEPYLAPQWRRKDGRLRPFAPVRYRQMLNAAYRGVNAAGLKLVTAGTGPYGDPTPGGKRIMPVTFWRTVLRAPTRFDVLAHHPYGTGGPRRKALNAADVAIPDLHKLVRVVNRARRAGTALPAGRKRFWVTEVSWDSKPPDPFGIAERRRARWVSEALYILWKQGVDTVLWFRVGDQSPEPAYDSTYQSGLYTVEGTPKRSQRAFAFPLACEPAGRLLRVWAKAPEAGEVILVDGDGRLVRRLTAGRTRIVTAVVRASGPVRAVSGGTTSLLCRA